MTVELWREPIIAWQIETTTYKNIEDVHSFTTPITTSGDTNEDDVAIQGPNGYLEITYDRSFLNESDLIDYYNEKRPVRSKASEPAKVTLQ